MFVVAAAALTSCKRTGTEAGGGPSKPGVTSPAIVELLNAVPANAMALGFVDAPKPPWSLLVDGTFMPLSEPARKTLDKELRDYVAKYVGLDVSKVQYAVGFGTVLPPGGAVLIKAVGGELKLPGATDHEGAKLWKVDPRQQLSLAIKGDLVVFGKDVSVRDVLATVAGKQKSVTTENKPLVDWLRKETEGAALAFAGVVPKGLPVPSELSGIERVSIRAGSSGFGAVVEGDPATLDRLQKMYEQESAKALAQIEEAHQMALAGDIPPPQGGLAIIAAAYAKEYAARIKPMRAGNRLSIAVDLDLAGGAGIVAGIGVLSAVAIPAFMDYMKKSKKTEAALQLNKLAKNAKVVFSTDGAYPQGTTGLTPAKPCCGSALGKCGVTDEWTKSEIWKALDFQIDEPNLYQYSYESTGPTQATAMAVADLDCDGVAITYRLELSAPNGNPMAIITEPPPNTD
ncbi:MAG: hypothetical protein AB7O24_04840 [Kofleriaceae bacterium]